ncbi:hypothetical protein ACN469_29690 [Corallococcus terminator]
MPVATSTAPRPLERSDRGDEAVEGGGEGSGTETVTSAGLYA